MCANNVLATLLFFITIATHDEATKRVDDIIAMEAFSLIQSRIAIVNVTVSPGQTHVKWFFKKKLNVLKCLKQTFSSSSFFFILVVNF